MNSRGLFIKGLLVVSVVGLLCGYAFAAQQSGQDEPNKPATSDRTTSPPAAGTTTQPTAGIGAQAAQQPMQLVKSSELIGKKLLNSQNEDLGTIHDLVLTPDYKQVSYAALAHGGVFGIGSKLFAIPWSAIKVGADGKPTANITKDTLDQSPGFKSDNWPSQADSRLGGAGMMGATTGRSSLDQTGQSSTSGTRAQEPNTATSRSRTRGMAAAPGAESSRTASMAANMDIQNRRVSKLTGMSVKNPQNQDIGDVEDFVIDVPNGQVAYTIVSFGGFWAIGEKYAAVPAAAVDFQPRQGFASINADRQALESVAFDPGNWPDLTNREYAQRLRDVFKGEQPYRATLGYVAPGPQTSSETAWGAKSEYMKHFDPNQITTIKGTVVSVGTFEPAKGVAEGLRLRVKTTDGKTITVHAGPAWYARQQKFDIKPGDEVTITGANAKIGWRSVFIASEIQSGTNTLRLCSKTGEPLWTRGQMGQRPTTPEQAPTDVGQRPQGQPRSQTGQQPPRI